MTQRQNKFGLKFLLDIVMNSKSRFMIDLQVATVFDRCGRFFKEDSFYFASAIIAYALISSLPPVSPESMNSPSTSTYPSPYHSHTSSPSSSSTPLNNQCISQLKLVQGHSMGNTNFKIEGLHSQSYSFPGDINIGALVEATERPHGSSRDVCTNNVIQSAVSVLQYMEAIAYAVLIVNQDPNLLPNVSLGFYILDDCNSPNGAISQSMSFMPRYNYTTNVVGNNAEGCDTNTSYEYNHRASNEFSAPDSTVSSTKGDVLGHKEPPPSHYDVVGILGPMTSFATIPVSYLYTTAKLPILSYIATSDILSDKLYHRYFMRLVPPDTYQVRAMLQFIKDQGWNYISVLYQKGGYGESAFESIYKFAPSYNICIATSHRLMGVRSDYSYIFSQLLHYSNAKVVIIFSLGFEAGMLFTEIRRQMSFGRFIFIGSDGISERANFFKKFPDIWTGAITFIYKSIAVTDFISHVNKISVGNSSNPWLKSFWEKERNCSFSDGSCSSTDTIGTWEMEYAHGTSLAIDSVLTFSHALHKLLKDRCPEAQGKDARECVEGETLLAYLLSTTFEGKSGHIEFDWKGDVIGVYRITQHVFKTPGSSEFTTSIPGGFSRDYELVENLIGVYESSKGHIEYTNNTLLWHHLDLKNVNFSKSQINQNTSVDNGRMMQDTPESICSRPCLVREIKIVKEQPCCWECRRCRDNEKLVDAKTKCEACSLFTWPDPSTGFQTCIAIQLSYLKTSGILFAILISLAVSGIALTIFVTVVYFIFRNERVIKASSRELSILQLIAILTGYVCVILTQTKPSDELCTCIYFLFCLSFTLLYGPLLVKTVRIYRIFHAKSKITHSIKFVSPNSQLVLSCILFAFQVLICIVITKEYRETASRNQPIWSERLVELSCQVTLPGLISFLSYNLILVLLCLFFAFKTRKLPDNFNESRFISMCVSTTLIFWLAFIIIFFTSERDLVRAFLCAVTLLLNHTVALLLLFLPKIYAVTCLSKAVAPIEGVRVSQLDSKYQTNSKSGLKSACYTITE